VADVFHAQLASESRGEKGNCGALRVGFPGC